MDKPIPVAVGDTVAFTHFGRPQRGEVLRLGPHNAVLRFATLTDRRKRIDREATIQRAKIHDVVKRATDNQ